MGSGAKVGIVVVVLFAVAGIGYLLLTRKDTSKQAGNRNQSGGDNIAGDINAGANALNALGKFFQGLGGGKGSSSSGMNGGGGGADNTGTFDPGEGNTWGGGGVGDQGPPAPNSGGDWGGSGVGGETQPDGSAWN